MDTALAALEAAAEAISYQQQFSLLAKLGELAAPFPSLAPTLARLAEERAAFDAEADAQWEAHERFVEELRRKEAAIEADVDGDAGADTEATGMAATADSGSDAGAEADANRATVVGNAATAIVNGDATAATDDEDTAADSDDDGDSIGLAAEVATVLGDPDLRAKTEAILANPDARADLEQYLSDMNAGSLDDLDPEQQLGAMAAFILSRNDDDDSEGDDEDDDTAEATDDDVSELPVSGQLGAAVEALLSDAEGREMVDGLLQHPGFRQALIAELEESKVPVPLDELPHDIQRKFAAAFALEKGVISVARGDETES